MLLSIDHNTTYSYGKKVVLTPHTVRLCPRNDGGQIPHMFSLKTDPPEAGRSVNSDLDGNTTVTLWFAGESERLVIDTCCVVETLRENPFDFVVSDARFLDLPMQYPREQKASLRPYTTVSRRDRPGGFRASRNDSFADPGKNHGFYSHALRVHTQELSPCG